MVIFFRSFSPTIAGEISDGFSCNRIVFSVKFRLRFSKDFSDIFLPYIYFLSVSPDDICLISTSWYNCKEDILLVNVHFYTIMRYELMKWKYADSGCDYALDNLHRIRSLSVSLDHPSGRDYLQMTPNSISIRWWRRGATTTAPVCPSKSWWLYEIFEGAENIVVVTITGTLSGSRYSAEVATDFIRRASEYQYPRH